MSEPLALLIEELPSGIAHAALPTPFPVGPVNCWVLVGDPVTVVDPGMTTPDSLEGLEQLLASLDLAPSDIAQIVVTHGHPDHYGAAAWLAERSGAPIIVGAAERDKLLHSYERPRYSDLLTRLGIPDDVATAFPTLYEGVRSLVQTPTPDMLQTIDHLGPLSAGGRIWTSLITPGHATGHLSLYHDETSVLLSGDHLLPRITPNPVLEPDDEAPDGRRRSLVEYLDTLEGFARLDPRSVLPGHGEAFTDVPQLVERMREHHAVRAQRIVEVLGDLGPATPHAISQALFPALEGFGVMLGVSEVAGHLDLLIADEIVKVMDDDPMVVQIA